MENLDERIRASLSSEDRALLARLAADDSLYHNVVSAFQGRTRWLYASGWVAALVLFGVALYCSVHFVKATEIRDMLLWGAAGGIAFVGLGLIKLWFWMEIQKKSILRELKRVELLLASLGQAGRAA
jgi:hypothetical protein